jgi:hypothetical protein
MDAKKHRAPRAPGKTYHKDGHWVDKPHKTVILVCSCGNKYLKTRPGQSACLKCFLVV